MMSFEPSDPSRANSVIATALLLAFFVFVVAPLARSQQQAMDNMLAMNMPVFSDDVAQAVKRIADKQESEFNHHLAGVLVMFAGIFILAQSRIEKRCPIVRYAWPMCFLVAGLFLLVFSDTEIWPFGSQSPWHALTNNLEVLQHKTFAAILLTIGYVELQRARGRMKAPWAAWFFPVFGIFGAILLLFHVHSCDMQAPNAMETMEHIQKQHRWFATAAFGIALTNGLAGTGTPQRLQPFFKAVWPAMLIVLGILLARYME
jgi:hypothetical protein